MGKCIRCRTKEILSNNGLCDHCFSLYEEEKAERERIQSNFRVRKSRLKKKLEKAERLEREGEEAETEDGFALPTPMLTGDEHLKDLEHERREELTSLLKKARLNPDPYDYEFEAYEKELSELGGDSQAFYLRHGFPHHPHVKMAYVEKDICPECGRSRSKTSKHGCQCEQQTETDWNFSFGRT